MIRVNPDDGRVIAIYRGVRYVDEGTSSEDHVSLNGNSISMAELDELFSESMLFDWRGKRFSFISSNDGFVTCSTTEADPDWARDNSLEGSPYDGWVGTIPEVEVERLRIRRFDILASWRHEKQTGNPAPRGSYVTERPATAHEWGRD